MNASENALSENALVFTLRRREPKTGALDLDIGAYFSLTAETVAIARR